MSVQHCCDHLRRNKVAKTAFNGIDWIEVLDHDLPPLDPLRQRTLLVRCLRDVPALDAEHVVIEGGERVRDVAVAWAEPAEPIPARLADAAEAGCLARLQAMSVAERRLTLVVRCSVSGDFSTYQLRLRRSLLEEAPAENFDPRMTAIAFRFKVECNPEFDCKPAPLCPPDARAAPDIDYLARDYASLRRLLLDRIAQQAPGLKLDLVPDVGMGLVELLAYAGDQLAWRQDAIATEAYLGTARQRVSLRRHAQLVDYAMHDGCNARTFVHVRLKQDAPTIALLEDETLFLTQCEGLARALSPTAPQTRDALATGPIVFQPMMDAPLYREHNEILFHTWSDERCCLPRGATHATLAGSLPDLQVGDFLLFEEKKGPLTDDPADADPTHRHVVRVTRIDRGTPASPLRDPIENQRICEIDWSEDDALPFPLCLSSVTDDAHGAQSIAGVSVARGNLVLADHGRWQGSESLGPVPEPSLFVARHAERCKPTSAEALPVRFRPRLAQGPLTHAAPLPADDAPAAAHLDWDVARAIPQITLASPAPWFPLRNLLDCHADDRNFVAEIDESGRATLRFGDDEYGMRPNEGTTFEATYRVGQGAIGNVGAGALWHIVTPDHDSIESVRNPLPAGGGRDPETAASVRRRAPQAFRRQERAVTEADYADVTRHHGGVQRAQARLRWTGSWHTVFVAVDRDGGAPLTDAFEESLVEHVDRYRMAGHDLEFDKPIYVPLGLKLHVCVKPDYFRAHVKEALLDELGARRLPDGRVGLFHPDRFTFGQTVFLSPVYAAAHAVPGVDSVRVTVFGPQDAPDPKALADGKLELGRLQIARLDNDPNFPEHGRLELHLDGGK